MNKARVKKFSIVMLLVMVLSLFGTAAHAQDEQATVEVFRIDRTFVILKITFPTEIGGSFAGTLAGKHFDCVTLAPSTLICIGRFRVSPDPALLTIYDLDTKENILEKVIYSPRGGGENEEKEDSPAPVDNGNENEACVECFIDG